MELQEISSYIKVKDGKLLAYYAISFPVYVVHIAYDTVDSDPFFPVYRAILKYILLDPSLEKISYFYRLIGFEKTMIEDCKKKLREEGMISFINNKWVLSESAHSKYLQPGNRSTVRVTGTFLVDGKDLSILPKPVYQNKVNLNRGKEEDAGTHKPIDLALSKSPANLISNKLEKEPDLRSLLNIDTAGSNFEVLDFDKRFLKGLYIVFYLDSKQNICKESLYMGHKISCPAIGDITSYSIEMRKDNEEYFLKSNLGYNVGNKDEASKNVLFSIKEGWQSLISRRYNLKDSFQIKIDYDNTTKLPVIILDNHLAENSKNLRQLIEDANKGYITFSVKPNGVLFISTINEIPDYVEIFNMVSNWMQNKNQPALEFTKFLTDRCPSWRKILIRVGMYDQLEAIDSDCFILNK